MILKSITWVCQIVAAAILGQTLYFKFSGAVESQFIFDTIGIEPWGRIGAGVIELIIALLLLTPWTAVYGALMAVGAMSVAIMHHILFLGIEIKGEYAGEVIEGDGGTLFILALVCLLCSGFVLIARGKSLCLCLCNIICKKNR